MSQRPDFTRDSLIVAAHADDEVLWFSSILAMVDEVIVVYRDFWAHPGLGKQRTAALAEHPHPNIACLGIQESGAYGCADWSNPVLDRHGAAFGLEARRRAVTRVARKSVALVARSEATRVAEDTVRRIYEANTALIEAALRPKLRKGMNVFTHNPWGEYGHEEHLQVFRVLDRLRTEIGFTLWMSNYCSERSLPLAMRYFGDTPQAAVRLPTDKDYAERVAAVYRRHGCWTWADDWTWFDDELFLPAPAGDRPPAAHRHLFPLNLFTIDAARPRNWLPVALTMSVVGAGLGVALSEAM